MIPALLCRLFRCPFAALAFWAVTAIATGIATGPVQAGQPTVTVFAAASLKTALDEIVGLHQENTGDRVAVSYGGSSALARQIQYGAPAQIFLSANGAWMDVLENDGLIDVDTRIDLVTNQLVLIAATDVKTSLVVAPGMDLTGVLGGNKLAMALTDAVPAGIYGRAALVSLGIWEATRDHIAQTDNVRAALRLVALGEAPLGIVYATDANADSRVRLIGAFPQDSHPPILYPAAHLRQGGSAASRALFRFLTTPEARAVFVRHGFGIPGGSS